MVFWFCQNKAEPTETLSQKPEPNHNQMFFEIRNQTQPKPDPNPKELKPVVTLIFSLKCKHSLKTNTLKISRKTCRSNKII